MSNHVVTIDEARYTLTYRAGAALAGSYCAEIPTKLPILIQEVGRHFICKMRRTFESAIKFIAENIGRPLYSPMWLTAPSLISDHSKPPPAKVPPLEPSHANAYSLVSAINQKAHIILAIISKKGVYS